MATGSGVSSGAAGQGGFGVSQSMINTIMSMLGLGGSAVGGIQAMQRFGDLIRSRNTASDLIRDYIRGSTMPEGTAFNMWRDTALPYLQMGTDLNNLVSPAYERNLNSLNLDLDTFRSILPGLMESNYSSPELEALRPHFDANVSRLNSGLDYALGALHSGGWNENSQRVFNNAASIDFDNPYISNLTNIGGHLLETGGMTPYTQNALDQSGFGIRQGGYDPNINRIIQESFNNLGIMRNNNQTAQGLINSGGYDNNLQTQFNTGLRGLQQFANADPMSILGGTGQQAVQGLFNSPYINQGFQTTLNQINNLSRPDPTFASQQSQGFNQGMRMANTDMNSLAPWMSSFAQLAPQIANVQLPQLSDFSQFLNISAPGGGGGGVGAAAMSRDLGPVDPKVQEAFEKSLAAFENNPLMSKEQAMGLARDAAATAAKQQSEAAYRKAVNMGGPGILVGSGGQSRAMTEFADQAMQAEAAAVRDALFKQQELGLVRSGQEADLAKAMGQLKGNREGLFANMNIADADNQTRAAIASAQLADSAAGRGLQAQMANASNALSIARLLSDQGLAKAQLQSGLFNSLLGSATEQRGQNAGQAIAGLNSLPAFLNASNDRFSTQTGALGQALSSLPEFGRADTERYNTILQSLLGASGQATERASLFSPLISSATGTAANRLQSGVDLASASMSGINNALNSANTAVGSANDRLKNFIDLFSAADRSNLDRMTLGANMTNQGIQNVLTGQDIAGRTNQGMLDYASNMGNLVGTLTGNYNTAVNNFGNLGLGYFDANTRQQQGAANMFNNYLTSRQNNVNSLGSMFPTIMQPFQNVSDQVMNYMMGAQNLWSPFGGMFSLSGGVNNTLGGLRP